MALRQWTRNTPAGGRAGFTMIEAMIAIVIVSVVLGAAFKFMINQRQVYGTQEQVAEVQQGVRIGMDLLTRELRMAGFDPTENAGASIISATDSSIHWTMDLAEDGDIDDANEDLAYYLSDIDGDGDLDLVREDNGSIQSVAENIESLAFAYVLEDGSTTAAPGDPSKIREVEIALCGRTAVPDPKSDTDDGYRKRLVTTRVRVRNLGL